MPALQATEKCHHDLYDAVDPEKALSGTVRGLNVLVSGASRGAGKAIALAFSVAGAANLFLTARSEDALQETVKEIAAANPSCKCFCYPVDLGRASVDEAFEKISKVGPLNETPLGSGWQNCPGSPARRQRHM
ncbi:hypothetical protein MMC29_000181 [Sticta canariensis]|nr:hypothetical protein [Sticta canariensis]